MVKYITLILVTFGLVACENKNTQLGYETLLTKNKDGYVSEINGYQFCVNKRQGDVYKDIWNKYFYREFSLENIIEFIIKNTRDAALINVYKNVSPSTVRFLSEISLLLNEEDIIDFLSDFNNNFARSYVYYKEKCNFDEQKSIDLAYMQAYGTLMSNFNDVKEAKLYKKTKLKYLDDLKKQYLKNPNDSTLCLTMQAKEHLQRIKDITVEKNLVSELLNEDIAIFVMKGKSFWDYSQYFSNYIITTPQELQNMYGENEINANRHFKDKTVLISGFISSINAGINDHPFIILKTTNGWKAPQAHFTNSKRNIDRISELNKKQLVSLICKGHGEVMGTPILSECEILDIFTNKELSDALLRDAIKYLTIKRSITNKKAFFIAFMIASILDNDNVDIGTVCLTKNRCNAILPLVRKMQLTNGNISELPERFKALGYTLQEIKNALEE